MFNLIKLIRKLFIYNIKNEFSSWEGLSIFDSNKDKKVDSNELQNLSDKIKSLKWDNSDLIDKIDKLKQSIWEGYFDLNQFVNKDYFDNLEKKYDKAFSAINKKYSKEKNLITQSISKSISVWSKVKLNTKAQFTYWNGKTDNYDVYLEKRWWSYILSVDDYFDDTYKVFDYLPSQKQIEQSLKDYSNFDSAPKWWKEGYKPFIKSLSIDTDENIIIVEPLKDVVKPSDKKQKKQIDNQKPLSKKLSYVKADRYFDSNDNHEFYDVILKKKWDKYILEVDDWGTNTYKVFDQEPTKPDILSSVAAYNAWDEEAYHYGWENTGYKPRKKPPIKKTPIKKTTQNKPTIKKSIEKLSNEEIVANFDIKKDSKNQNKVWELQKALRNMWYVWKNWKPLSLDKKWGSNTKYALDVARLSTTDKKISHFKEINTKETASSYGNVVLWISMWWKERNEALESVNISSLNHLLKTSNLENIIQSLQKALCVESLSWVVYGSLFHPKYWNTTKAAKVLEKYGYEPDGILWYEEVSVVIWVIEDYLKTQNKIPSLLAKDKVRMLFDFDKNAKLSLDKNFYVWELQMDFHVFESLTSSWVETLFKNLNLWTIDSFSLEMSKNLFLAREKFQRVLWVALSRWIKPSELLISQWVEKANERIYSDRHEYSRKICNKVDNYVETVLKRFEWVDTKALKLEALWILLCPNSIGVWSSFDIRKLDLFFDSLQVWLINGIPWISISKKILEKNNFKVTWSQPYLIIPTLSWVYKQPAKIDEFTSIYPKTIKSKTATSSYAWISLLGWNIWISSRIVNEKSSEWIEKMTNNMSKLLKKVSLDIKAWKSFEQSSFYSKSTDKLLDSQIYAEMKNSYDFYAKTKPYSEKFLKDMMTGYLGYYENRLYSNAQGIKLTSFGVWIALLAWFLPIPYLSVWWEKISTNWNKVLHSIDRERSISSKSIDIGRIWMEITQYKGKKVVMIPNSSLYNVSNSLWKTQLEIVNDKIYLSWDLSNLIIDEHTTSQGVSRTIVIKWWLKNINGLYIPTKTTNITSSISENKSSLPVWKTEQILWLEAIESTKNIRRNLFNIVGVDALNHKKTIGMQKLQRMIFDYKTTWKTSLSKVWTQFNKVVKYPWFKQYAKERWQESQVIGLLNSLNTVKNDTEKVLILQSISSNLMKKWALQNIDEDDKIEVAWEKKTISLYDKDNKRAKYFDKQFSREFPKLLPQIQKAREQWYASNGSSKQYSFKTISDGSMAFTWVESRKASWAINVKWIMPYTWVYNIASTWWKDFIEINWKSPEVVDSIPNIILENIKSSLNSNWAKLKTLKQVKEFINSGWNDLISIDYKLAYCKMWECLNDSIILKDLKIKTKPKIIIAPKKNSILASSTSELYNPNYEVISLWVALTWEIERKDKKSTKNSSENSSEEDSSTPWTEWGWDNWWGWDGGWNNWDRWTDSSTTWVEWGWDNWWAWLWGWNDATR